MMSILYFWPFTSKVVYDMDSHPNTSLVALYFPPLLHVHVIWIVEWWTPLAVAQMSHPPMISARPANTKINMDCRMASVFH